MTRIVKRWLLLETKDPKLKDTFKLLSGQAQLQSMWFYCKYCRHLRVCVFNCLYCESNNLERKNNLCLVQNVKFRSSTN